MIVITYKYKNEEFSFTEFKLNSDGLNPQLITYLNNCASKMEDKNAELYSIYANENELKKIIEIIIKLNVSNIPYSTLFTSTMWHGSIAKFIFYNLLPHLNN